MNPSLPRREFQKENKSRVEAPPHVLQDRGSSRQDFANFAGDHSSDRDLAEGKRGTMLPSNLHIYITLNSY